MWLYRSINNLILSKLRMKKKNNTFKYISYILVILVALLLVAVFNMTFNKDKVQDTTISNPIVVFETSMGTFEVELFLNQSPITAGNFKDLVQSGYYDGIKFHRVIDNFMIQAGDPLTKNDSMIARWGSGGPGYAIKDEFIEGLSNVRGTLAMANSGPNTGGSQFFINTIDNIRLDWDKPPIQSRHPVFGKVVSGMDVIDDISKVETTGPDRPVVAVVIEKAYLK